MTHSSLPPDDQPASQLTSDDHLLRRQLDASLTRRFEQNCDPETRELLSRCDWYITTHAKSITLVVYCLDAVSNWQVLHQVLTLGQYMEYFSPTARIRICPPPNNGTPFEIRVDELSIYQDPGL